ncbi:3-dehydroquinate synthase [Desulfuromonas acetoxidans]|uniref:3-dehydroquinate synthase n=1 Tax=Desulfuromonas acetoxidans (strain DSM 684 / 11070) TaxID=281689 RepID=Q1K2X6_DESA6|nr:3-dehydroquinate synthase [Desulfuromonas acetoxidans]EAT16755.1 3-dehydroquinate synthase [Desulfuromonas acetoxidans DSM 684]MBF0644785.1 3-dehydroquinate synthase [Desulfuromonas acetoxidans]NVD23697.1 3-dehydroquinate synthase [Desulfuromonas acetoxidans]NVE15918.1 3-dehydroquinate synthase [Desulfuromonas acetoxidans]
MEQLSVGLGDRSYQILITHHGFSGLSEELQRIQFPGKVVIVTNTTVLPLYGSLVSQLLTESGYDVEQIVVEDGESYKNAETLNTIYTRLIELGCDRHSGIIALGGGVVGDMAGYAAATFLRGIPFVQIPTTVLAQVDSSVGGKTAINHPLGKNLIGAFYQPWAVFINVATLETLDQRNVLAGIAEVIKYGVMFDETFFSWLEEHVEPLLSLDTEALAYAVRRSCELKAEVVAADERESSVRAVLNFGHTFGHAVEQLSGYGTVLHGEAVAIGMLVAANVSRLMELCQDSDVERLTRLLEAFGFVTQPPPFSLEDYLAAMGRDKKVHGGILRFIVNVGIGESRIVSLEDPESVFKSVLG